VFIWRNATFIGRSVPMVVCPRQRNQWGEKMKTLLSFITGAALALAFSSTVSAASPERIGAAMAQMHHHYHWQPRKHHYGKRMRAHWGASCKMSGSC
jgi:hypothetical protein